MAETPEPEALEESGQPQDQPSRPEYLMDNFATVEDQARAYREARLEMQAAHRDRAQQEQLLMQMAGELEARTAQAVQASGDPLLDRYSEAVEEGDAQTMLAIHAYVAEQAAAKHAAQAQRQQMGPDQVGMFAAMVEQQARQRFGDDQLWEDLKPEIGQLILERPYLLPNTGDPNTATDAMLFLADIARQRKTGAPSTGQPPPQESVLPHLREAGLDEYHAKRLAQSMHGAGVRPSAPQDDDTSYWDRVKGADSGGWKG